MLILASNSPRRKELLTLAGWSFTILPADVDESPLPEEKPGDYVLRLATAKAHNVAGRAAPGAVVVAADTTVVDGVTLLGKPETAGEAEAMLRRLRGRTHQVYTALAVLRMADNLFNSEVSITDVGMRDYSDGEIQAYVESGDALDKAGAYAIQHPGFSPVKDLQGCYTNVVGLPVCRLARILAAIGLYPAHQSSFACLYMDTGGVCSFSPLALNGNTSGVQ